MISVHIELILGHLCYILTDVPPQPNSLSDKIYKQDSLGRLILKHIQLSTSIKIT